MRLPIIACLALLSTPASAQRSGTDTVEPLVPANGAVLDVAAQGRTTRTPDLATINAGVTTQAPTAAAALSENGQRMNRVLAALRRAGIAQRDVTTRNVQLSPQYRYEDNKPPALVGYQATNGVAVRFREIGRAGAILDALVAEGANQIDGPTLSLAEPDSALDEARADAVKRARARAELYARAAGLKVVRLVSIAETGSSGPMPPPMPVMRMAARADATPVVAGEQDVTVDLSVRFLLD